MHAPAEGSSPARYRYSYVGQSTDTTNTLGSSNTYDMRGGRPFLTRDTYNIPSAAGSTRSVGLSQTPSSSLLLQESIAEVDATASPLPVPGSVDISVAGGELMAKTPTFEYYGFVVYMVSMASFVVYLAWAYLPDSALEAMGISYYPDRYWALALPAWWLTAVGFILLFNVATNMYNTPLLSSLDNITDPHSNISDIADATGFVCDEIGGIPPISDLPITLANKCLYH
ncbi:hypothetical protein EV175_003392 [Coemansia sp. RSA 1933]|nr:hypothetical protein EV175_003392 [Coemansia sp. RSA 1933]